MIKSQTDIGTYSISNDIFAELSSYAASNCFGVKAMVSNVIANGFNRLVKGESNARGVRVLQGENGVAVELHIAVKHGVNIAILGQSVKDEVRYVIEKYTGIILSRIDVCVDAIVID